MQDHRSPCPVRCSSSRSSMRDRPGQHVALRVSGHPTTEVRTSPNPSTSAIISGPRSGGRSEAFCGSVATSGICCARSNESKQSPKALDRLQSETASQPRPSSPAGALAVLASGPAARSTLAFLQLLLVRRMRRARVASCLASSTQQMNSLRARGVMSFQASSAVGFGDQRCAQVGGKFVHHPAGDSVAAHRGRVAVPGRAGRRGPRRRAPIAGRPRPPCVPPLQGATPSAAGRPGPAVR